jgi:hypothetical protein
LADAETAVRIHGTDITIMPTTWKISNVTGKPRIAFEPRAFSRRRDRYTSPLNYLIQIQCEHVLLRLYRVVVVPLGVIEELRSDKAPFAVKTWFESLPSWLEIRPLSLVNALEGE